MARSGSLTARERARSPEARGGRAAGPGTKEPRRLVGRPSRARGVETGAAELE